MYDFACRTWRLVCFVITGCVSLPALAELNLSEVGPLNSNAATDIASDNNPTLATNDAGMWIAVWSSAQDPDTASVTDSDIWFARSTNAGETWSTAARLNTNAATDSSTSEDLNPQIACFSSTWVVVWTSTDTLGDTVGDDYDIFFAQSTDNGATWSAPAALNSYAASDTDTDLQPKIVYSKGTISSKFVVAWESDTTLGNTIGADNDIIYSISNDLGATWTAAAALNSNAATDSGIDYAVALAANNAGTVHAVWNSSETLGDTIGNDRDIFLARSMDQGASWQNLRVLNDTATEDGDSQDFTPSIVSNGDARWVVMWESTYDINGEIGVDKDIFLAATADNGDGWSFLGAALPNADQYKSAKTGGPSDDSGVMLSYSKAIDAFIAVFVSTADIPTPFPLSNSQPNIETDFDLLVSYSTSGSFWSQPKPLHPLFHSDNRFDELPTFIPDSDGNVVALWRSTNSLNSTIGTDADVLYAYGTLPGLLLLETPNGDEKWKRGKKKDIWWDSSTLQSGKVRINLLRDGDVVDTIKAKTKNDGAYKWRVPDNLPKGGGYQVEIIKKGNGAIRDVSYQDFKVK